MCVGLSYDNLVITCQVCKLHHHLYFIRALGKPALNRDLDLQRFLICSGASHSKLFPCCSLDLPFVWAPSSYIITIVSDSNWSYSYHSKIVSCIACPKGVLNWYHGSTIKNNKTRSINSVLSSLLYYRDTLTSCRNIIGILKNINIGLICLGNNSILK